MAKMIMINPSSGDNVASLFSSPNSSNNVLKTVNKGDILKLTGSNGGYYLVEYDNNLENKMLGGNADTGTVLGYPYTIMYSDSKKTEKIGKINNGSICSEINDEFAPMISVKAFTTEGWQTGFIEAKYIYRDNVETRHYKQKSRKAPSTTRANNNNDLTGTLIGPSAGFHNPSQFSEVAIPLINTNTSVKIIETNKGWHNVSLEGVTTNINGASTAWVPAKNVQVNNYNTEASVSKTDATEIASTTSESTSSSTDPFSSVSSDDEWQVYFSNYDPNALNYTANDEYYRQLADKYSYALGVPPRYNMDIDVQYIDELVPGGGRVVNKTVLSNPSILSIIPGKVKMFPNLFGTEKDSIVETMMNAANGNTSLLEKIQADQPARFTGKLYRFQADTEEYAKYVNALCRACAIMLGIGDELMPNTSTKLKYFDYSYWTIRKKYNPYAAAAADNDSSLFRNFWNGLVRTASRVVSTAVDETAYINFFMNGTETSVSETMNTSVTDSPLSGVLNTVSSVASQLNYFTGSGFDVGGSDMSDALHAVIDTNGIAGGMFTIAENFLKGGKMVLPKMLEGSQYGRSISCNLRFVSPYGSKYAVFLRCLVPICHLIAMSYPRQLSDNMYGYPFLVRCAQTGSFNVDLGVISSLTINRGGSDETSWTVDTLATEWDVQMEITPLVDELMLTSTSHPVLMCKNEMLLDYLANFCGFDMLACNVGTKVDMMMSFIRNKFITDPFHSIENKISDFTYNVLNHLFSAKW